MNSQQVIAATANFAYTVLAEILAVLRRSPWRLLLALALAAAILPLTGCDDDGVVFTFESVEGDAPPAFDVTTLAGTWRSNGHDLTIRQLGFNHYQLSGGNDDDKFEFHLAGLGGMLIFDFFSEPDPEVASAPLHFPCKLDVQAPDMVLSCLSRQWIEQQSEMDVPRTMIKNDLVLTGSAPDLTALLRRVAEVPEAFHEVWRLHRARLQEVAEWREAAAAGEAWGQEALAEAYASGADIDEDANLAVAWMTRAAEQGRPTAQQTMGEAYRDGYGPLPRDPDRALAWFRAAAEQNHPPALFSVGRAFEKGEGVLRDGIEAAAWYRRAAKLGYAEAWYRLGYLYESGDALPRSHAEAIADYRKAVQADASLADAWDGLARLYAEANDPELRNLNQALGSARRAVELKRHNADYLTTLARVYYLRGNYDDAVKTLRAALETGPTEERQTLLQQYLVFASAAVH